MKTEIQEYVVNELLSGAEIGEHDDLLLSGLVDSLGVMRLVAHIEQRYGITVPPQDLTIENFATIADITSYVDRSRKA
jgi:acyl carrier protein